jgi:hypothetical protein
MNASPEELAAVVGRLEEQNNLLRRQNRRLNRATLLALGVGGLCALMAAQPAGRDGPLFLKDGNGRDRVKFEVAKDGPVVRFLTAEGREQAGFHVTETGVSLRLVTEAGQSGWSVEPDGIVLMARSRDGNTLVGPAALKNNAGLLVPRDGRGRDR